jgi:translation initiation factor IF-1
MKYLFGILLFSILLIGFSQANAEEKIPIKIEMSKTDISYGDIVRLHYSAERTVPNTMFTVRITGEDGNEYSMLSGRTVKTELVGYRPELLDLN